MSLTTECWRLPSLSRAHAGELVFPLTVLQPTCLMDSYCDIISIFGCKEYNQSDFGVDHLVMSMCRVFPCVVGRRCLLWPVRSSRPPLLTLDVGFLFSATPAPHSRFTNIWTVNFQMFKLDLEKAEEPEIKLPTSAGSWKKQENSRKTSNSALLIMPKPLTMWITINCGKFWERWEYQTTGPASWETYMQVRKQQLELDMEQQTGSK